MDMATMMKHKPSEENTEHAVFEKHQHVGH